MEDEQLTVTLTVNGRTIHDRVEPRTLLSHFLRDTLGLTGTHIGCDTSQCGACTVLMDGAPVKSCTVLAVQADGAVVTTVEGLADGAELHPVQRAFREEHGLQCGFCTPGAMMLSAWLIRHEPQAEATEIREALDGLVCRCTGYENIVHAVQRAQSLTRQSREAVASGAEGGMSS